MLLRSDAIYLSFTEISGRDLIAGTRSFGALLEDEGYYAVPSPRQPFPGTNY